MKKTWIYIVLIIFGITFLYPFLWMISATFKPEADIGSIGLIADQFTLQSYEAVFKKIPIGRALLNSLFVSTTVTMSVIFFGSIVFYVVASNELNFSSKSSKAGGSVRLICSFVELYTSFIVLT